MRVGLSFLLFLCFITIDAQNTIVQNGFNQFYYPNGKLLSEGNLINGKPEGYWKTYYTTGILKSEGNRRNHLLDSIWIFYNSVGDTSSKTSYLSGKKNGYHQEYYFKSDVNCCNVIKSKELFVNNKKVGLSYYFYNSGKLKEELEYVDNKLEGRGIEYAEDGRIITLKDYRNNDIVDRIKVNRYSINGKKDGIWIRMYDRMLVQIEENYRDGKLHGYYKEYDKGGRLRLALLYNEGKLVLQKNDEELKGSLTEVNVGNGNKSIGLVKNGVNIGIHKTVTEDGKVIGSRVYDNDGILISEGIIDKRGYKIGNWKNYYQSGSILSEGKYNNNLREGKWTFYFEDGVKEQVGSYNKGREDGTWIRYYKNGEVFIEESFYLGVEDGEYFEYDLEGNIIAQGEYLDGEKEGEWIVEINDFKAKGKYITGLPDGKWKHFYDDGTVLFEGNYIQGLAVGKHKYYYPDGSLKEEQVYSSGVPDKHWKKYNELGELVITITYKKGKEYRINGQKINLEEDRVTIN